LIWDYGEALGALIFFLGIALLFSAFFHWPKFVWAWAEHGPMGSEGGPLVFGTMAAGIVIWAVLGMQRFLDAKALDDRELPTQPGWYVTAETPEQFEETLKRSAADPDADTRYPRVPLGGASPPARPVQESRLEAECRTIITDFLRSQRTRAYEMANDAWWKRDDLRATLFKAELHLREAPDALSAAFDGAMDGLVRDGMLQGTDSGYRASEKLTALATPVAGQSAAVVPACPLCGKVRDRDQVAILIRTGQLESSDVLGTVRQGNTTITTTLQRFNNVMDVEAAVCRTCWQNGRVSWHRLMKLIVFGIPVGIIVGLVASLQLESALLGISLMAVSAIGGLAIFILALKGWLQQHPMARIKRRVLASPAGGPDREIIAATWPLRRPTYWEGSA
jgi:hypothetical protein